MQTWRWRTALLLAEMSLEIRQTYLYGPCGVILALSLSDFLILSYRDLGADADDCFSGLRNKSPRTKNERRRHASLDLSTLIPPPPPPPAVYWFPFLLSFLHTCSQCAAMNCIVGFVRQPPSFLPPLERIGFTQGTPVKFV